MIKNDDGTVTVSSTKYNGKYLLGNLLVCGDCGLHTGDGQNGERSYGDVLPGLKRESKL